MPEMGVPRQYSFLARYCGRQVPDDSVAVAEGEATAPALQGVSVLIQRAGHLLRYFQSDLVPLRLPTGGSESAQISKNG